MVPQQANSNIFHRITLNTSSKYIIDDVYFKHKNTFCLVITAKMTTPLFWKSLEISSKFYDTILKYSLPLVWDYRLEQAIIQNKKSLPLCPSIYFLLMLACIASSLIVIFEDLVLKTVQVPLPILLTTIVILVIVALCQSINVIIYPNLQVFYGQYFNALLEYERRMKNRKITSVTSLQSVLKTLKSGMLIISKTYLHTT